MQLVQYSGGVKTFNKADILKEINTQRGFQESVHNTLRLAHSNNIDLDKQAEAWAVTKSIMDKSWKKYHFQNDLVDSLSIIVPRWKLILDAVEKVIRGESDNVISGQTLTIRQANCLMVLDYSNFYCTYATQMLEVLLTLASGKTAPKADLEFLNNTREMFIDIFVMVYDRDDEIIKKILNGQDVEVDQTAIDVLSKGKGESAVVAMASRDASVHQFLPMYWFKTLRAEYDLSRIRSLRESSELSAMKIEQISNRMNGQVDPKLERQIEIHQNNIIKNRAKIESIEARYE